MFCGQWYNGNYMPLFFLFFFFSIHRATVLYDQPPEFFRPALLEEKHKVKETSFENIKTI
ncbi:hypothetical protein Hanom_Chr00s071409g01789011 [Helianthus anomalus]